MNLRPTVAEINLLAIESNFLTLKSLLPSGAFFCPMVKANAYGHGAIQVSKKLEDSGAQFVGVSLVEEGIELRRSGIKLEVLVFGTFYDSASAQACLEFNLTPVISSFEQLRAFSEQQISRKVNFHLKFETGMSRLGFPVDQAQKVREELDRQNHLHLQGICTHLAKGEDIGLSEGASQKQFESFDSVLKEFSDKKVYVHALNSSGLGGLDHLKGTRNYGGRPGISMYGPQPIAGKTHLPLQNVMTLKSKIVSSRWVPKGRGVSYNAIWTSQRESLIGVLPIGYADGISRGLSNKISVLCRGQRIPAVGIVCMDYMMLDLTGIKDQIQDQGVGEEIVLIGKQGKEEITALEWAQILGTITYEIFTSVSNRVPRTYANT